MSAARGVVVVTGAASGIGKAVTDRLLADGYEVLGVDRQQQDERPGLHPARLDVLDVDGGRAAVAAVAERGPITGLVTSAGVSESRRVEDYDAERIAKGFEVNFMGTAAWLSIAIPHMRAAGGGRIVTVASQLGERPVAQLGYYCAAKAAVMTLTKTAAVELAEDGIAVNCVCPGPTDTPLTAALAAGERQATVSRVPLGRMGTPNEIAEPIAFLLTEGASFITGSIVMVDGGFCAA